MKMTFNSQRLWVEVRDYFMITLGIIFYCFCFRGFIYSHEITSGGLAGFASLLSWWMNIDMSIPYNIINFSLLVIAVIVMGWKYVIRTIFGIITLGFFLTLSEKYITTPFLAGDTTLAVVLGSIGIGISLGIVYSFNGATGGTDVVAMIVNKYRPVSIGRALMCLDSMIIAGSYFLFRDTDKLLYSIVQVLVTNITVDYYMNGYKQSMQFFIISPKFEEITKRILSELNRGCTLLNAEGGYSQSVVKVLMVTVRKTESTTIFRIVKELDPEAFITQTMVHGVFGRGFEAIKVSKKISLRKSHSAKTQAEPLESPIGTPSSIDNISSTDTPKE